MAEIIDRESARAWAEKRSVDEGVAFHVAAAIATWPFTAPDRAWQGHNTELDTARAILSALVRLHTDTDKTRTAAGQSAVNAGDYDIGAGYDSFRAAQFAEGLFEGEHADYRLILSDSVFRLRRETAETRRALERLGPIGLIEGDLWTGVNMERLLTYWNKQKAKRLSDLSVWGFWVDWYEGLLSGIAPDWQLWHDIVLIPDNVWQEGPEAVAREIELVKANLVNDRLPISAVVRMDEATGLIGFDPQPTENQELTAVTLEVALDALTDVLAEPSNGLSEKSLDVRRLKRSFTRY